jgi:hypothetical protein
VFRRWSAALLRAGGAHLDRAPAVPREQAAERELLWEPVRYLHRRRVHIQAQPVCAMSESSPLHHGGSRGRGLQASASRDDVPVPGAVFGTRRWQCGHGGCEPSRGSAGEASPESRSRWWCVATTECGERAGWNFSRLSRLTVVVLIVIRV